MKNNWYKRTTRGKYAYICKKVEHKRFRKANKKIDY